MAITRSFESFVLDQLSPLGPVYARRMFGGAGLYLDDVMFALLAEDILYLKTDDGNRQDFEKAGLKAFQPFPNKPMTMSYHEAPTEVLENLDLAVEWVEKALAAAKRAKKKSQGKQKPLGNIDPKPTF